MIYEWIASHGKLTDDHAHDLRTKRGFTDETIKRHRLFSAGKHNLDLERELLKEFPVEDLLASGVFLKKKDGAHIDPVFLDDRVIIPYLDKDGKALLLRPHKLGLKAIPVMVYHAFGIKPDDTSVIITEGEFKAVAAYQLGFSCIALPGVSSFSGRKFEELTKFLNDHHVKDICICFDNEIKDDPKLPNYKADAMDRYDTQYYAYIMAKELCRAGFNARVATLPDSWRVRGKIDIDGALALGKTASDLLHVVKRSLDPKEYHDNFDDEVREIVRKKEAKRFFKTHISKEYGKYVAQRFNGKKQWDEVISNFTLRIVATHETAEGIVREVQFVNEFGKSAAFFSVGPEEMSGNDGFSTFCFRHGNFVWSGRKEDLYKIWEQEFMNDSGRHIIEPDCVGWLGDKRMWIFGNVAFDEKGNELRPDDHNIFWTDKFGVQPIPLGVSTGKSVVAEGIPHLSLHQCDIQTIKSKLVESIGDFEAKTCLGWAVGVLFMEEVFALYNCFPFLFITGRRRSGKSTVAEWMMNLFGLENSGKQAADTTSVAIQRYMSYYSSLPLFIDEYRNDSKVTAKNGLFRNAYNRQSAGKGMKSEFGIREAKIRGGLIIAGEETPEDNALLTRCVVVPVSEGRRIQNNFDWFTKNRAKLSAFAYEILKNRKAYSEKFLSRLLEDKREIAELTKDDRLAINRAVVSAGAFTIFGEDDDFATKFVNDLKVTKVQQEAESAVSMFFQDLQAMSFDRSLRLSDYWDVDKGKVYLFFHGLYNVWAKDYQSRKREAPFKADAIRSYLKDETGFVESNYNHRIKGQLCKCVVFLEDECPDFVKNLVTADPGTIKAPGTTAGTDK